MSNEQPLNTNNSVNNKSSLEKPIILFLSAFEIVEQDEQSFDDLISILSNILPPKSLEKKFSLISGISAIAPRFILFFTITFALIAPFVILFLDNTSLVLSIVLLQAVVIVFAFVSSLKDFKKLILSAKLSDRSKTELALKKIKDEFIKEKESVKLLRNNIVLEKLKLYEIEIEKQIKNTQANQKVAYNLLLLVPVFIAFIIIYIYGEQAFNVINNISLIPLKLTLLALYPTITGVFNSLYFRGELDKLNKYLSCLKKAQVKQEAQEPSIEKSGKKESFMSQIRKIKIDAPADFSTNYEKYM